MMTVFGIICLIIKAISEAWSDAHYKPKYPTHML
jgi:hypothetical protein